MKEKLVRENETLDDLIIGGLKIIQGKDSFRFAIDAVLLAHFTSLRRGDKIMDLGTGSGIIPLLLHTRAPGLEITGLELQEEVAERANRSIGWNGLRNIKVLQGDLRRISTIFSAGSFKRVTSNPPYMPLDTGKTNLLEEIKISRHETTCTLEDLVQAASWLLQYKGTFALVHRAERIAEILMVLSKFGLEVKRVRFVHSFKDKGAKLVLMEAAKGGAPGVQVEKPLILYDQPGVYSEEILKLYQKEGNPHE